ncbi:MAG TPA: CDP-alcohol phosphatidyltransferase family protein [Planctomycetota bacterium]|nr:CDP-alcohol phosphatidyltransferase family protein [Planctomycetota bacterium]
MPAWQEIKELHRKTTLGAKEGVAFRYFSRPVASFILYYVQHGALTPNQVTILSLLVGVAGSVVHAAWLSWAGLVAGGALFMIAHMLDALDGQLARHRKAGSVIGMHFDFFIDGVKAFLMYGALAVRLYRQAHGGGGDAPWGGDFASPTLLLDPLLTRFGPAVVPLIAVVGMVALATGVACTDFMKKKEWKEAFAPPAGSGAAGGGGGPVALLFKLGHFIVDYPSYILILCLLNRVDAYLLAYTATVGAYAVQAMAGITLKLWRVNPYAPKPPQA